MRSCWRFAVAAVATSSLVLVTLAQLQAESKKAAGPSAKKDTAAAPADSKAQGTLGEILKNKARARGPAIRPAAPPATKIDETKPPIPVTETQPSAGTKPATSGSAEKEVVQPKPISNSVDKGLQYLVNQQHPDGGWGQGGGWRSGTQGARVEGPSVQDPSDVANTSLAGLALLRSGHTPKQGRYADNVKKAIDFVCGQVEASSSDTLYVTDLRGTQVQSKIGPYVDTFVSSLFLVECKGHMPDQKSEERLQTVTRKVIEKIERNQQKDGTWANGGWAPVWSQALGTKGLNRARQNGYRVKDEVLVLAEKQAKGNFDRKGKTFGKAGSAGVDLYAYAANAGGLKDSDDTNGIIRKELETVLSSSTAGPKARESAEREIRRIDDTKEAQSEAVSALADKVTSQQFVAGFGSNGGEEFISYMNIGESLLAKGGKEWRDWDQKITTNLEQVQNTDGSWVGSHCITGRTFCTASALLVLMTDRMPTPLASKMASK